MTVTPETAVSPQNTLPVMAHSAGTGVGEGETSGLGVGVKVMSGVGVRTESVGVTVEDGMAAPSTCR